MWILGKGRRLCRFSLKKVIRIAKRSKFSWMIDKISHKYSIVFSFYDKQLERSSKIALNIFTSSYS